MVDGFVLFLGQVEYQEVFRFVNYKEFTKPRHESATVFARFRHIVFAEVKLAPFDLHDRELANVVPDGDWSTEVAVIHPAKCDMKVKSAYAIDPQLKPTSK